MIFPSHEQRKNTGSFYTPKPLAQLLAREVFACLPATTDFKNLKILDPAAGDGGLLLPFAQELAAKRQLQEPTQTHTEILRDIFTRQIYAADISAEALAAYTANVACLTNTKNLPLHLYTGDSLAAYGGKTSVLEKSFATSFDIIIANPPYIGQKGHADMFKKLRQNPLWEKEVAPKSDLLYFFFLLALRLLKPSGMAGFLTTPYFSTAQGAARLRKTLRKKSSFLRLLSFEDKYLFDGTNQHTLLSIFQKGKILNPCWVGPQKSPILQRNLWNSPQNYLQITDEQPDIRKVLSKMGKAPLRLENCALVSNGLMTGCDKISAAHLKKFNLPNIRKGEGVFVISQAEKEALSLPPFEEKKLKPFFKNSDIFPYVPNTQAHYFLIDFFYPNDKKTDFSKYPRLRAHLKKFKPILLARKQNNNGIHLQLAQGNYWFASVRRRMNFEGEKILVPHRASRPIFAYSNQPWYASSDVYFISAPQKNSSLWYLLGLLNTRLYWIWLFYKGKRKGKLLELYSTPLKELPIPHATSAQQDRIATLAKQIFQAKQKKQDTRLLEQQMDQRVCHLFSLSSQEQKAVLSWKI